MSGKNSQDSDQSKSYGSSDFPKSPQALREEEILDFWNNNSIFLKTLEKPSPKGEFVFYEGPPTANGRPGIHHLEARAFKDVIPRYKTMRGYHVRRKAGWDTHGLPVELEVEKRLGLNSKKEIEEYGIDRFNEECRKSVWTYVDEWRDFTDRTAYWVDLDNPYVTYEPGYMQSVWHVFKKVFDKGLVYKDYKVVPWCPRCGTALSSHELAQGYEVTKDISVYVTFKVSDSDEYFLAWTTTPWTLPGNVALAVSPEMDYVKVEVEDKLVWVAKERLSHIAPDADIVEEVKGKELVGKSYDPLYPFLKDNLSSEQKDKLHNAFKVYPASFVTPEDGSGIVHTAVMYGQDDFELGTEHGLPKHHLVGEDGNFLPEADFLSGIFVKDADIEVIKDLAHKNILFKKEKIEHTYPFCWRCKTPLIYFARDSWYIRMSDLKDKLVEENKKINWEPKHIGEGRFGEWLREIKDWAISRERYWGTPLPIWKYKGKDGKENIKAVGSIDELKSHAKRSGNKYIVMRHGEAENNVENLVSSKPDNPHHLTEKGKKGAEEAVQDIKSHKVDLIISSDFVRTKETAEIVAEGLGLDKSSIVFDERVREFGFGDFEGRSIEEYHNYHPSVQIGFEKAMPGGESFGDTKRRLGDFLYDLESRYKDKNILIVTHSTPAWLLFCVAAGADLERSIKIRGEREHFFENTEVQVLDFVPMPHNKDYELDLHKPYIDEIEFFSETGERMERVPEVMDVWFDSGAMPFAQDGYPVENKEWVEGPGYPADYISEALDQTRGWFYTLHAIGNLMDRGRAYKNVICLGLLLDKDGKKMSKSKGNTVNPWDMSNKYGVDALRFWMYSINQPGEAKNFDEKSVDEVVKKVFNLLLNVVNFYEMYKVSDESFPSKSPSSDHALDRWIVGLLDELIEESQNNLDGYKTLEPSRKIRDFIADLSQWYVRRSRDRFKGDDEKDRRSALETTHYVLLQLAKVMAPFMPFLAEDIYQRVKPKDGKESVHLEDWPELSQGSGDQRSSVLKEMEEVRKIVSLGLEARARAGIKVRQPLGVVFVKSGSINKGKIGLLDLIKDEMNVKKVEFNENLDEEVEIDTEITPALKEEGQVRDLVRYIQALRKENNFSPNDPVKIVFETDERGQEFVEKFKEDISKSTLLESIDYGEVSDGGELKIDEMLFKAKVSTT